MGGDLPARPATPGADLLLQAMKDPTRQPRPHPDHQDLAGRGAYKEKLFDVALSGGRRADARGGSPGGDTVDLKTGAVRNTIGAAAFTTAGRPEFDPARPRSTTPGCWRSPRPGGAPAGDQEPLPLPKGRRR